MAAEFNATGFLLSVASAASKWRYNASADTNAQAVGKLMQAAAAIALGAVDHGYCTEAGARAAMLEAVNRAFDTVKGNSDGAG
jgi:hypothetical protein